jgi:HTH-type transcriptional regulator/antitoxin HipB
MRLRTPKDIGLAIRERRRALGLDQKTLAARIGVSRQWIIDAEKGKRRAELWLVLRTFSALGVVLTVQEEPMGRGRGTAPAATTDLGNIIAAHRKGGPPRP